MVSSINISFIERLSNLIFYSILAKFNHLISLKERSNIWFILMKIKLFRHLLNLSMSWNRTKRERMRDRCVLCFKANVQIIYDFPHLKRRKGYKVYQLWGMSLIIHFIQPWLKTYFDWMIEFYISLRFYRVVNNLDFTF